MLFKNAMFYTYSTLPELSEEAFEIARFTPCQTFDFRSEGFVPPEGYSSLVNRIDDFVLICLLTEERILPAEVVRRSVNEIVDQIEKNEDRKIYRKERNEIKDDVIAKLLPRAFTKQRRTHGVFVMNHNMLIVDAASSSRAESFISNVRTTLGSLPAKPIETKTAAEFGMTNWVRKKVSGGGLPKGFQLGEYCKLKAALGECTTYTLKDEPDLINLADPLISENNMEAIELEMGYSGVVGFVLTNSLSLKKIKFGDIQNNEAEEIESAEAAAQANLLIWGTTVVEVITSVCAALSGTKES